MNNENPDPRNDPAYQDYLRSLEQQREPLDEDAAISASYKKMNPPPRAAGVYERRPQQPRTYAPPAHNRPPAAGKTWDRTKETGSTFYRIEQGWDDKKTGMRHDTGHLRFAIQDYEGHNYVSIENWKPQKGDEDLPLDQQVREVKKSANIKIRELRDVAHIINRMADELDGGESK